MKPPAVIFRALIPTLVALLVTVGGGLALIGHFGVTWDFQQTAVYGERTLRYFATGDSRLLDFTRREITYARPHPPTEPDPSAGVQAISSPEFVWPLPYTLGALGCRVLYLGLGWLDDPFAAHHVVNLVLAGFLLGAIYRVLSRTLGRGPALAGAALLAAYPAFFSHLFNNLRDIPVAVFFGLSLLSLRGFVTEGKKTPLVLFFLLQGCALASKTNAVFIAPIALVWTLVGVWAAGGRWTALRRTAAVLGASLASPLVAFALWPWLWHDTLERLGRHIDFIRLVRDVDPHADLTPILEVVFTLPVISLILGLAGLAAGRMAARRGCFDLWFLAVLWMLVPIARICLPRARNYGGVRHFIEFAPAWFLLAAFGIAWLGDRLAASRAAGRRLGHLRSRYLRWGLSSVLVAAGIVPAIASFPDGSSFYNLLVGGPKGARRLGLSAAYDFWGNSFRRGIAWLDSVAPPGSALVVPIGEHIPAMTRGVWLREDIDLVRGDLLPAAEGPGRLYVLDLVRPRGHSEDRRPWLRPALAGRRPDFEILLEGASLLRGYDLGDRARGVAFLRAARAADREQIGSRIEEAMARARRDPDDLQALQEAYLLLRRAGQTPRAEALFREIVPRIKDPVLAERVLRWLAAESKRPADDVPEGGGR